MTEEYKKSIMSIQHGIVIHQFSSCEDNHVHVLIEQDLKLIDAVLDVKDFCAFLLEKANLRPVESSSVEGEHGGGKASTRGKA